MERIGEAVRDTESLNQIIKEAIDEVLGAFGSEITERDQQMLKRVYQEETTTPEGRVVYLSQIVRAADVSPELIDYVEQVKQTLWQKFNQAERNLFQVSFTESNNLLDV